MGKFGFIDRALTELHEKGLYNTIRTIESPVEGWVKIEGKRVLNLCSNNYLGFANDPRLAEAAKRAIDEYGVGRRSSPISRGPRRPSPSNRG